MIKHRPKYHMYNPHKDSILTKTSILQYLNTLIDTCNNYNPRDDEAIQKWNDDMVSLQTYLFGIDPVDGFSEEVYLNNLDLIDLIIDEYYSIGRCIYILSYAYTGPQIANIMYDACMKKGIIGRTVMELKMFVDYSNDNIKWYSILDMVKERIENSTIQYHSGIYYNEFWNKLNNKLSVEQNKMNHMARMLTDPIHSSYINPMNVMYLDRGVQLYIFSPNR